MFTSPLSSAARISLSQDGHLTVGCSSILSPLTASPPIYPSWRAIKRERPEGWCRSSCFYALIHSATTVPAGSPARQAPHRRRRPPASFLIQARYGRLLEPSLSLCVRPKIFPVSAHTLSSYGICARETYSRSEGGKGAQLQHLHHLPP